MKGLPIGGLCLLTLGVVWTSAASLPLHSTAKTTATPLSTTTKQLEITTNRNSSDSSANTNQVKIGLNVERSEKSSNSSAIGESIKMVANQLLQGNKTPPPTTGQGGVVADTRTPPKMKNQQSKNKITKPSTESQKIEVIENSNAGVAIPMSVDEVNHTLNKKVKDNLKQTSTSDEGLSTWILLSGNPTTAGSIIDLKKIETIEDKNKSGDTAKKDARKPSQTNKSKATTTHKPTRSPTLVTMKPSFVRKPVAIGSSNKSDLIASGSAVNENVMNKIKASVLASIQKNKNAALNKTTTTAKPTTTTILSTTKLIKTEAVTKPKEEVVLISTSSTTPKVEIIFKNKPKLPLTVKVPSKPAEEIAPSNESVDISMEAKQVEIELEVSTPAPSTTKKPKRSSNKRKKNKKRQRKPASTTTKPEEIAPESKVQNNETKVATKVPAKDKPITTQIYNYLSREVMPSVGVGLVSLAGIVGLASYLFYPFGGVVRRAYDINDRKDDLYHQNDDQYANDGGQREEEMLGSLFPDNSPEMHNKIQPVNPYAGQTQFTYPQAKPSQPIQEQNIRHRNVAYSPDSNAFVSNDRVKQPNNDAFHGSAYSEHIRYDTHDDDRFTPDNDRFSPYQQPQPVYKSLDRQTENPGFFSEPVSQGYESHNSNSDPVYEYGHALRYSQDIITDTTQTPLSETLHLGAQDVIEQQKETGYTVDAMSIDENKQPQFVVGNIPKELIQAVTPVSVPEHGPRSLRKRRSTFDNQKIESAVDSLREILNRSNIENLKASESVNNVSQPKTKLLIDKPVKDKAKKKATHKLKRKQKSSKLQTDNTDEENETLRRLYKNMNLSEKRYLKKQALFEKKGSLSEKRPKSIDNGFYKHMSKRSPKKVINLKTKEYNKIQHNYPSTPRFPKKVISANIFEIGNTNYKAKRVIREANTYLVHSDNARKIEILPNPSDETKNESNFTNKNQNNLNEGNIKNPYENMILGENEDDSSNSILGGYEENKYKKNIKNKSGISVNTHQNTIFVDLNEQNITDVSTTTIKPLEVTEPTPKDTVGVTEKPQEPFSFLGFLKGLLDFKLRLGIGLLQTTTDSIGKYLTDVEKAFNSKTTTSVPPKNRNNRNY